MNIIKCLIRSLLIFTPLLFAVDTDRAIFLFDTGETNFVASMLRHAAQHDKERLDLLDFRIVFMGASMDFMDREPFNLFPRKLISYKELDIHEQVDCNWGRKELLSDDSLSAIAKKLTITHKLWTGVSTSIFRQLVELYEEGDMGVADSVAIRDYPFVFDGTDGSQKVSHMIRQQVSGAVSTVAIASEFSRNEVALANPSICVVGHPPSEEYVKQASQIDTQMVMQRMNLDPEKKIVLYAGTYDSRYQEWFAQFLRYVQESKYIFNQAQLLILPHPRYKGIVEKQMSNRLDDAGIDYRIVGQYEADPLFYIKTIEAACSADAIITSNATASLVLQANTLAKKVIHIEHEEDEITTFLNENNVITSVKNADELAHEITQLDSDVEVRKKPDIFELFGMPKNAAATLWHMFVE